MSSEPAILGRLCRKFETRAKLDEADRAAILALPCHPRTYEANAYIIREGEPPKRHCGMILSGYAFRQKLSSQGARQIVSLHMAGDLLDLQNLYLRRADHNVQALTRLSVADIEREALRRLAEERPAVARAMWIDALVESSIYREWLLNTGRRDAKARIAHLLCEFALRHEVANIAPTDGTYELPMTQEQIGDATGLTSVHVNRMLKALAAEGLVHRDRRFLSFSDWDRFSAAADFSALYLHLDQTLD